ncbi:hypothetical protein CASFOL_021775 [Castilleja foliolosa]|uniref:Uncharacterized protein n=1 Tax=Castilleja foliolosa TaxID=1961234 RepID=A0ABD3D100_9LAMI
MEKKSKLEVKYSSIPEDQKRTWELNENVNLLMRYNNLIEWIRMMGTQQGSVYEGKGSLQCVEKDGAALMEVQVLCRDKSAKFLISRHTLNVLAFFTPDCEWRAFDNSEMIIVGQGFTLMRGINACYTSPSCNTVGPKTIIDALEAIEAKETAATKGVEVFMVLLSEAARFKVIENMIGSTFIPTIEPSLGGVLHGLEHDLAEITEYFKPISVNLEVYVDAPHDIQFYLKNYKQLSKAWYVYALTRTRFCPLKEEIAKECGLVDVRHRPLLLDATLGVLCNCNLEKMLKKWSDRLLKDGLKNYPDFPLDDKILRDMLEQMNEN